MREPSRSHHRDLQVGFFVLLGFLAVAAFSFRLTESPVFQSGYEVVTYLDDATGLFKLTKVKQAGIPIGFVKNIDLESGKAKVTLVIEEKYALPSDVKIVARPLGILGDKYLEVVVPPGAFLEKETLDGMLKKKVEKIWNWVIPSAYAADKKARLKDGDVVQAQSTPAGVDDLTREMGDVTKDLKETSIRIRTLVERNTMEVEGMIRSMNRITTKLEKALNNIDSQQVAEDFKALSNAAGRMSGTLENLESITKKIDRGEGTLGKLVNDPETINELNKSLRYLNHAIERSRRIMTIVDMVSDYNVSPKTSKTYFGLRIMTRETAGYLAQVIVDPVGREKTLVQEVKVDGGTTTRTETYTANRSGLKYSILFYKRIGSTAFRLGLMESSGGIGIDQFLFRDRLQLTTNFFSFSRPNDNPHLKIFMRVPFWTYLYAQVGGDDLITKNPSDLRQKSFFASVGIRFTDEDIKTLFLLPGIP